MNSETSPETCPCRAMAQDKLPFAACCGPFLAHAKKPPTAEALMRSRYSAFATGNVDYLDKTLADDQRKDFDRAATGDWAKKSEWLGLDIVATEEGGETDFDRHRDFCRPFQPRRQATRPSRTLAVPARRRGPLALRQGTAVEGRNRRARTAARPQRSVSLWVGQEI